VSCSSSLENIQQLHNQITTTALSHSYMGERVPKSYLTVCEFLKKEAERKKGKKDEIPLLEIKHLTSQFGDESLVKRPLGLLSLWGECVYFSQPEELANTVILNSDFLTKEVMTKLFNPMFCDHFVKGVVQHSQLGNIWQKFPASLHPVLLQLMERFEVCFPLDGGPSEDESTSEGSSQQPVKAFNERSSFVPSYLPETEPANLWPASDEEIFRVLTFNVIPKELVSRLIVRLHKRLLSADDTVYA